MVRVTEPAGVVDEVVTVNCDVAVPFGAGVTDNGFNEQVAFAGQPETLRLTALAKPPSDAMVTVELPAWPCDSVSDGLADTEKSGAMEADSQPIGSLVSSMPAGRGP